MRAGIRLPPLPYAGKHAHLNQPFHFSIKPLSAPPTLENPLQMLIGIPIRRLEIMQLLIQILHLLVRLARLLGLHALHIGDGREDEPFGRRR